MGIYYEEKHISVDKLSLSAMNPRFTLLPTRPDNDFLGWVLSNQKQKTHAEIVNELIKYEGILNDLRQLITNIVTNGFDEKEELYVIKKNENEYVVGEGNRRIFSLKFLLGQVKLPTEEMVLKNNVRFDSEKEKDNYNGYDEWKNKTLKNHRYINKIQAENKKEVKTKIRVLVINSGEGEYLLSKLLEKHNKGTTVGLRRWPRGKYFLDLLRNENLKFCLKTKNESEKKKEITKLEDIIFRKSFSKIKDDYKQAVFIQELIKYGSDKTDEKIEDFFKTKPISALQFNYCFELIKSFLKDINGVDFKNNVFEHKFNQDCLISYPNQEQKIIKKEKLFKFILKWFESEVRLITTKPKSQGKEEFLDKFHKELIELLGLKNSTDYKNSEKVYNYQNGLKKLIEKIKETFLKKSFLYKFKVLYKQFEHNNVRSGNYFHAIVATFRTIIEKIVSIIFCASSTSDLTKFFGAFEKDKNVTEINKKYFKSLNLREKAIFLVYNEEWNDLELIRKIKKEGNTKFLNSFFKKKKFSNKVWESFQNKFLGQVVHKVIFTNKNREIDNFVNVLNDLFEEENIKKEFIDELVNLFTKFNKDLKATK